MTTPRPWMVITGSRTGIGRYLAEHYLTRGYQVAGCSRNPSDLGHPDYRHFCLDVADERAAKEMFQVIERSGAPLEALVNNAGIASMNHCLLTPMTTVRDIMSTNVLGTFLFIREAARLMGSRKFGRIVNFSTVAVPLELAGEAVYAASKAAVTSLTKILARELAPTGITINAVGPTPIKTDLIRNVPEAKLKALLDRLAIPRLGTLEDVANVVDFFMRRESDYVTGQTLYLGGA